MRLVTIINTHNGICTTHMLSTNASRALMCRTTRLPIFFAFAVAIVVALQFGLFLCQKNLVLYLKYIGLIANEVKVNRNFVSLGEAKGEKGMQQNEYQTSEGVNCWPTISSGINDRTR